jgi:predicted short-subunit dehydrogenase-like oxidoreductase (DUF2520 family)
MHPSTRKLPNIAIVGAGTLASALALALRQQKFRITEIISRDAADSLQRARGLATRVNARAVPLSKAVVDAKVLWICVPDDAISEVAKQIASRGPYKGKIVLHSSGALASDVLAPLKRAGATAGSAHPLMTFVADSLPDLRGVPFALEGDSKATAAATAIIRRLGGEPFRIAADSKAAYHAFGFFLSPAIVALIAAAQEVGKLAGLSEQEARRLMQPIVRKTIENCFTITPQNAFSGPVRRGDVATIRKHLGVLKNPKELLEIYRALVRIALKKLPVRKESAIRKLIE